MASLPFLRRKNDQRTSADPQPAEHGPAAHRRRVDSNLERTFAEAFAVEKVREELRREFAQALNQLRRELHQTRDVGRGRIGGIARVLGAHSLDIGTLAERVIRLEHPEPEGPEGEEASPPLLQLVPAPRAEVRDRAA
jgi:uncharacterized membrane protein